MLLHELRRGDRDGFVRYHALYRAPVYNLVRRLLHDDDIVSATDEVFVTAYRRIILYDGRIALRAWTYRAALDVCRERLAEREAERSPEAGFEGDGLGADTRRRGPAASDLGRRFTQALESLEFRYRAVLLLHDTHGLSAAETATAFAVSEDAAGALLFRAREAFRRAFEELSSVRRAGTCALAEQTAAGAVGRSLSDDEVRRLENHAGYCRHCRRTMAVWGEGPISLALFLEDAPLPQVLETPPVFSARTAVTASGGVAGSRVLMRVLARTGRALRGKTVAYVLAAACLALSAGLAVRQSQSDRTFVVVRSAGLTLPWLIHPTQNVAGHSSSRLKAVATGVHSSSASPARSPVASPARSPVASPAVVKPESEASGTTVATVASVSASSGGDQPAVAHPVTSAEDRAATYQSRVVGEVKATKYWRVSLKTGFTDKGDRGRAASAGRHRGKWAERVGRAAGGYANRANRDHVGKHHQGHQGNHEQGHAGRHHQGRAGMHHQSRAGMHHQSRAGMHHQSRAGMHHRDKTGKKHG